MPSLSFLDTEQTIEVSAPPALVWQALLHMDAINSVPALPFRLGVAYPQRAEIIGQGVGAIRRGVFSTGVAIERITEWVPDRKLSFAVVSDPPAMHEMSPYKHVYAPHVRGYFTTLSTSFELVAMPGGRTEIIERTSHRLRLDPIFYWMPMARWVVGETQCPCACLYSRPRRVDTERAKLGSLRRAVQRQEERTTGRSGYGTTAISRRSIIPAAFRFQTGNVFYQESQALTNSTRVVQDFAPRRQSALANMAVVSMRAWPKPALHNVLVELPSDRPPPQTRGAALGLAQAFGYSRLAHHSLIIFHAVVRPQGHKTPSLRAAYTVRSGINPRGTGTARNTFFLRCLRISKTTASSVASMRPAVKARTSEIRAPVNASVKQKVDTGSLFLRSDITNASLSLA